MIINKPREYSIQEENSSSTSKTINFKIHQEYQKNIYLIHRVLRWQLYQNRQGNAHTKTRSEVQGGGKKPWKQKGTGRARAGSSRSPLWRGGGVIFGPRSKKYKIKINKKEKKLAIQNIIYNKFPKTFIIQENFKTLQKPNTKIFIQQLKELNLPITHNNNKILFIVEKKHTNLYLSLRNIPNIDIIQADHINILAILQADFLIITLDGLNIIQKIYQ
uniref:Large ribosomal subunit protein uL4c n=1 Tax=Spermothamnion repens TaxID=31383 RepID=A0A4D6WYM2_9FLOR|nr:ribosomal protein L4 [Spermothamnion repens]